eukprot:gene24830-biopygen16456
MQLPGRRTSSYPLLRGGQCSTQCFKNSILAWVSQWSRSARTPPFPLSPGRPHGATTVRRRGSAGPGRRCNPTLLCFNGDIVGNILLAHCEPVTCATTASCSRVEGKSSGHATRASIGRAGQRGASDELPKRRLPQANVGGMIWGTWQLGGLVAR